MVIHELSTNAVKYGALSGSRGAIEIGWTIESEQARDEFSMTWTEHCGPRVKAPDHRGFGTTVITKMVEISLDGEARLDYAPAGLAWRMRCPLQNVLESDRVVAI
jgi:two-component sensor histidine kinase